MRFHSGPQVANSAEIIRKAGRFLFPRDSQIGEWKAPERPQSASLRSEICAALAPLASSVCALQSLVGRWSVQVRSSEAKAFAATEPANAFAAGSSLQ